MTADVRPVLRRRRGLLIAAAALAAAWFAFLVLLAVRTANPVTVNREQLRRAASGGAVAVATPEPMDASGGLIRLRIERVLRGEGLPNPVLVGDGLSGHVEAGRSYVVPLTRTGDGFAVTLTRSGSPSVYPATAEVVRAAEDALSGASEVSYE